MDDCCHDDAGFRASSVEFSAHNRAPSREWRPRPFAAGCTSSSSSDDASSVVPPTPPPTHRSISAPTNPTTTPAVSGGLLDLVRLQQHRHSHIHQRAHAGHNSPIPLATSPSLLYDDPPSALPPTSLALPKPATATATPTAGALGAARTLNFISVPGVTEGVDICGDGVLGREGGLSPYYHLLGGGGSHPITTTAAGLEGRGLVRLRSAPPSVPSSSQATLTPQRAAVSGTGAGAAVAVLGTPPRKGRVSSLSGPEAYGASDVMIHAYGDDEPKPLQSHPSMPHQQQQQQQQLQY